MITARQISVSRGGRIVLEKVDLSAYNGKTIGIVGPNGSGKSTLLQTLYRQLRPLHGSVIIDDVAIETMKRRNIATQVAVVAQETDSSLPLTVRDAVALGRLASRSLLGYGDKADQKIVNNALEKVGLTAFAAKLITELSGGERQRVFIARAITQRASHLLLDEPTNHLDLNHQFNVLEMIDQIDSTTIVVLHDLNLAARYCDVLVLLEAGRVVKSGPPSQVLEPKILEQVYRINVERIERFGRPYLIFDPV